MPKSIYAPVSTYRRNTVQGELTVDAFGPPWKKKPEMNFRRILLLFLTDVCGPVESKNTLERGNEAQYCRGE